MRIIPKNTKVKLQFYKNITITDVILAVIGMSFWHLVRVLKFVFARNTF